MEREKCRAHLFTRSNLPAGGWRWSEGAKEVEVRKKKKKEKASTGEGERIQRTKL